MSDTLEITLRGRQYHVACKPEERAALLEAAAALDIKMGEIAGQTATTGERLAIMTALNLTYEMLAMQRQQKHVEAFDTGAFLRRIDSIEERLEAALGEHQERLF